jgi:predicted transcriptional regulator
MRVRETVNVLSEQGDMKDAGKNTYIMIYIRIHKYMADVTTIRIRTDTKALLDDLKLNPRETYDDVVRRLAEAAYDDEPMTAEEIAAMEDGIADIKAGRTRTLRDVMKELGDDTAIDARNP